MMADVELVDEAVQADWFSSVRDAHSVELREDYVELIADLIAAQREARVSDIAARMGVALPTASRVIARLVDDGYVVSEPYRSVFLTAMGEQLAAACKARHALVVDFLMTIGVPEEIAQRDAEGIEHHVSDVTLQTMQRFIHTQRG